jgi:NADH-quinone oxidoreductase subunit A
MLIHYQPIVLFIALAIGLATMIYGLGMLFSPHYPEQDKNKAYECGFDPFEEARLPFDVRFYLVAILFIIFDLETAFFFPWGVVLRKLPWYGVYSMGLFLLILTVGFIYEWRKGALEW